MTPTLNRRLQLLIDDDRFRRLERLAGDRGVSVAQLVRDAIDDAYFGQPRMTRQDAARYLLDAPPLAYGLDDWEVEKARLLEEQQGKDPHRTDRPGPARADA